MQPGVEPPVVLGARRLDIGERLEELPAVGRREVGGRRQPGRSSSRISRSPTTSSISARSKPRRPGTSAGSSSATNVPP
ncbi:hypothetical protein [Rathayibacter oskolensis]|uniref:hypothetical protein n=1 Tax=Rathayibacter oskolensis TaxID=1891671 RepID=UPI003466BFDA